MLTVNELQELSHKELSDLQSKIALALLVARERDRDALKERIVAEAKAAGFSVKALFTGQRRKPSDARSEGRRRLEHKFKYVNPKQPTETWTGRGRRPAWLAAQIKAGKPLDRFLRT